MVVLLVALVASEVSATTRLNVICGGRPKLDPWTKTTEPGVTVRCGPSKGQKLPGKCSMLTVAPKGSAPWTVPADDDPPDSVRSFNHGELLLVGNRVVRICARGRPELTVNPLHELTWDESQAIGPDPCHTFAQVKDVRLDGAEHVVLVIPQTGRPEVELRVSLSDGKMSHLTPPFIKQEAEAPPKPAQRPVAPASPPKTAMPAEEPRADDSLCASAGGVPLMVLAALGFRRRRGGD